MNRAHLSGLVTMAAAALLSSACSGPEERGPVPQDVETPAASAPDGRAERPTMPQPTASAAGVPALIDANRRFAVDLYRALAREAGAANLFLSPHSVSTALAMTWAGARGATASEMARVLHFTQPPEEVHAAFSALAATLAADDEGYRLSVANRLWGQRGYDFLPSFASLTRERYGAGLAEVDFAGAGETARGQINDWVAARTQQKIRDLLPAGVVTPLTRLVLTNAIYFKGSWASPFEEALTRPAPFHLLDGESTQVPLMSLAGGRHGLLETAEVQVLQLAYAGDALDMVVVLPRRRDGLAALEARLDGEALRRWTQPAAPREVDVFLPRFRIAAGFSLGDTLTGLGMASAFEPGAADFSGMSGNTDLYLTEAIHRAFVEVNEEGTEAAAATAVVAGIESVVETPVFRADHPFLFLIRDSRSGALLFVGRLTDPRSG